MRWVFCWLFLFIGIASYGNDIDKLSTDDEVQNFICKFSEYNSKYSNYRIPKVEELKAALKCGSLTNNLPLKSWLKADLNGGHQTDLVVNALDHTIRPFIVLSTGKNSFSILNLYSLNSECSFASIIWE